MGDAIFDELTSSTTIEGIIHPPGQYIDPISMIAVDKRIILDCTYIDTSQLESLGNWLINDSGLTSNQLSRIIEVNSNLIK